MKLISAMLSMLLLGQGIWAGGGTISFHANPEVVMEAEEWVTFGIPVKVGVSTESGDLRVMDASGTAVPVYVEPVFMWHFTEEHSGSIRSFKVQMQADLTAGAVVYSFDFAGRNTLTDPEEQDIADMVMSSTVAGKGGVDEPRVVAVIDPDYLATTGLIPAYIPSAGDTFDSYIDSQFELYWEDFSFEARTGPDWLFDRTTALYKYAMRSGRADVYLEAYRSYHWWYSKLLQDGSNIGSFNIDGQTGDSKYMYAEPVKLHVALSGDDSEYDPAFVNAMVKTSWDRSWGGAQGLKAPYTTLGVALTERHIGLTLLAQIQAYEMTGDAAIRQRIRTGITNIHAAQNGVNPDGLPNDGSIRHSWFSHEGDKAILGTIAEAAGAGSNQIVLKDVADAGVVDTGAPLSVSSNVALTASGAAINNGDGSWQIPLSSPLAASLSVGTKIYWANTTWAVVPADRGFSPWMIENISDALWHAYFVIEDEATQSMIEEYFRGAGQALALYGFSPQSFNGSTRALLESAYEHTFVDLTTNPRQWSDGCSSLTPVMLYYGSSVAPPSALKEINSIHPYTDQHTPETILTLTLAAHFEVDANKKEALMRLISDMSSWFDSSCASARAGGGLPWRGFNWQHRSNAWGTHLWVKNEELKNKSLYGINIFGQLYDSDAPAPYVYSTGFSWLYNYAGRDEVPLYIFYAGEIGWFMTNESLNPWLYSFERSGWLWFSGLSGEGGGVWFYDLQQSDYVYLMPGM